MKTIVAILGGLLLAALAVLTWQTFYQKSMLLHLQKCLAWNDRMNLNFPTQRAYFRHCRRDKEQRDRARKSKEQSA